MALELTSTSRNTSEITTEALPYSSIEQGTGCPTNNASSTPKERESRAHYSAGGRKRSFLSRLLGRRKKMKVKQLGKQSDDHGLSEKRSAMMVVSVLIATLTYQAALNPPGGFWQEDQIELVGNITALEPVELSPNAAEPAEMSANVSAAAGTAINSNIRGFQWFLVSNTVGLFASLVVILLLTSAITVRRPLMMWVLMIIMWISIFSVAFSFFCGVVVMLRGDLTYPALKYMIAFLLGCMLLFALLVLLHAFIGLKKMFSWLKKKLGFHSQNEDPVSHSLE